MYYCEKKEKFVMSYNEQREEFRSKIMSKIQNKKYKHIISFTPLYLQYLGREMPLLPISCRATF